MKEKVVAAAVQMAAFPPGESERNVEAVCRHVEELAAQGVELIAFPELGVTSFFCEEGGLGASRLAYWERAAEPLDGPSVTAIARCVAEHGVHAVVGFAERGQQAGVVYNSAALLGPDGVIGVQRKGHAAGMEKLYYTQAPEYELPVFDTPLGKVAISICYDAWHPEYVRCQALAGAEIVVCINSVWKGLAKGGIGAANKRRMWELVPVLRAFENQIFFVACNGCGTHYLGEKHGVWERMGLSRITDPHGAVLAAAETDGEAVIVAELDASEIVASRSAYPMWADRRPELFGALGPRGRHRFREASRCG